MSTSISVRGFEHQPQVWSYLFYIGTTQIQCQDQSTKEADANMVVAKEGGTTVGVNA